MATTIKAGTDVTGMPVTQTFTEQPIVSVEGEPDPAPQAAQEEGRPVSRDQRERAAAAVRAMQDALAPTVDALYETPSGMDVMEAFNHFGRAADALHYGTPGATGIALAELAAASELLRSAAGRSTAAALALNPIVVVTGEGIAAIESWPTTHAGTEDKQAFTSADARLVLTPVADGYVLTDNGEEVARFAAEDDAMAAVSGYAPEPDEAEQGTPFNIFLCPEGVESGDGRMLEIDTVTWRDPPLALMIQDTSSHGEGDPAPAWFAGAIEQAFKDPEEATRILGRGHLVPGPDGERAEATIRGGMRGVSIDGMNGRAPRTQVTQVDETGMPVGALVRYSDTKIMGATVVPHPAFENCCIWFDDEITPDRVTATHGEHVPMDAEPEIIPIDDIAQLVASGGGPAKPPKAWFDTRRAPDRYEPVTREGAWIHGHLGKYGSCHIGIAGKCETIPTSSTNYRYFHRTIAETAEGDRIACGWLTMNTIHKPTGRAITAASAMEHYSNTGTQVAKVRIVDTPHGPWMTGAVAPGLDEQTLWKLQAPDVSGDWRDIDGYSLELVAVLGVSLPGFMSQRPEALVASGQIVAQIGTLPCEEDCDPPAPLEESPVLRRLAATEAQLAYLRPLALAAIAAKIAPTDELLEKARLAEAGVPQREAADRWRERLRV